MKILKVKCLAPTRLDNYLMQQFPALNPGRLNKALRENKIKLNGKKCHAPIPAFLFSHSTALASSVNSACSFQLPSLI